MASRIIREQKELASFFVITCQSFDKVIISYQVGEKKKKKIGVTSCNVSTINQEINKEFTQSTELFFGIIFRNWLINKK